MLEGLNVKKKIDFSLKRDTTDPKTIFVLKCLSGLDMIDLQQGEGMTRDSVFNLLNCSIVEIKNFEGSKDKEEILNSLDAEAITELIDKVNQINTVTEEDEKN